MTPPPVLTPALADFVTSHLSIHIAASDARGIATLVRGLGCRRDPADRDRLRLLVAGPQAEPVLRCLAANGRIAAVFSEPESHRTVQLKGRDAGPCAPDAADAAFLAPYTDRLVARLATLGTPEPFVRTLLACPVEDLRVIRFTPDEVFGQTPGPQAGQRLSAGSAVP
ncbi:pyridoxamine 5'-phosphate oxidase family protein [Denitromonas iodatirespirans]|uniref:Pyridoxamine 5'-phosphate oxidase family protein n=1 Tax=Denitromonas iodatirespirans TaxID=2795389 RepID=A0A944HFC1_DENI1|nr:pyridoxamine 5'-phosphate oxidase family protein [Denitromonas iodatirespirans]MBT0963596.1 pyridoxamine 5'-phosphate oxidase family protein [Denitromonas iodatirespirans]